MSQPIATFLKVDSPVPIYIVASFFFFTLFFPLNMGILQGLQQFLPLGFYRVLNFLSKFIIGVILVTIGFGVNGALAAITLSAIISLIASFYSIRPYLSRLKDTKIPSINYLDVYKFSIPSMLTMFCFAVPANVDVVIAKHFFAADQVGFYTAASVLGKVVLFIPEAIAMVMFPKVAEASAMKKDTATLFRKSLLYTALLSGGVTLSYWIFPTFVVKIPFGLEYLDAIPFVRYYGLAMFLFSLSIVVMRYCLAMHDVKFVAIFTIITISEIILLWFIHNTLMDLIIIILVTGAVLFLLSLFYVKIRAPKLNICCLTN
jgi:O-antigen/teichoic acid export membrane protein